MIGTTIAHYKILEKLGEGGMGVVYKAQDTKLDRFVALKFLPFELAEDAPERARFLQEAKAAAALNHPNICVIHDLAEHDGQQFIVMEYVEGVTLRQKIAEAKQSLKDLIEWASQIADAIQAAHKKGITHRDIKSDNIMVNTDNQIKVMDFGLAKLKGALKLTKSTSTVGTLAYMAPEQLQGLETDSRMDIFSFGVVLYEMLAGCLPFRAEYESALMYAIVNMDPEPISKYRPGLSSELLHLLNRALEKDPNDRYQTMQEVLVELRRVKRDSSKVQKKFVAEGPPGTAEVTTGMVAVPARKRTGLYVGAVVAIAAAAAGWFLLQRTDDAIRIPRFSSPVQVLSMGGTVDFPCWSSDGRFLAYHSDQGGNMDIWVRQLASGTSINLTADYDGVDGLPSYSPDGEQIAFWSSRDGSGYYVMPALGGNPRKILATTGWSLGDFLRWRANTPQWSLDGKQVMCVDSDTLVYTEWHIAIVSVRENTVRKIQIPQVSNYVHEMSWSPDGRYCAYIEAYDRGSPTSQLWILRLEDRHQIRVTNPETWSWNPTWSPDGKTLYYVSNQGGGIDFWQQSIGEDGNPVGDPIQLTTGLEVQYAVLSRDGTKLVYSKGREFGNVWRAPIPTDRTVTWSDAVQVTHGQINLRNPNVSRDGTRIVFDSDHGGIRDIWILPLDGGEMRRVSSEPTLGVHPTWSPDGRLIAYHSHKGKGWTYIYVVPTDGGPMRRITDDDTPGMNPVWSPDGKEIAFYRYPNENIDIYAAPAAGGEARRITTHPAGDLDPWWSPDGQWILFGSRRSGNRQLWRIPSAGGDAQQVTSHGLNSRVYFWSRDGEYVFFVRDGHVWRVPAAGGTETQVTDLFGKRGRLQRVTSDEDNLYFAWRDRFADLWVMDVKWEEE